MIGSRSCCGHENSSVDRTDSSGPGFSRVRTERLPDVPSDGADAERAGGPIRYGIAAVALRPGGLRVANRGWRAAAGKPLRPSGSHNSWPDHREHFLVSPAAVPQGCGYSDRRRDPVGDRGVLSPPGLRRPVRTDGSVAHPPSNRTHAPSTSSFPLSDPPSYRYTPASRASRQRDSASTPTWLKKSCATTSATF